MINLENNRYDEIERTADEVFEDLGICVFPNNPFFVLGCLGVDIVEYSNLKQEDRNCLMARSKDGFTTFGDGRYTVYYNDGMPQGRVRFTLWHEIGHIMLEHFDRDSTSYREKEAEANHFAAYCIAPMPLIIKLQPKSPIDIENYFITSHKFAIYMFEKYQNVIKHKGLVRKILKSPIVDMCNDAVIAA